MVTVLVVDDEPDVRLLVRIVAEQSGHVVVEAADGVDALAAIDDDIPDLVLTDLNMPVMDGLELRARLAATRPALPVQVWSTNAGVLLDGRRIEGVIDKRPMELDVAVVLERLGRGDDQRGLAACHG